MRNVDKQHQIVRSALSWQDTPYHHHGRIRGVGVDCAQFLVGVAYENGLITEEQYNSVPNYPVQWHLHNREEKLLEMVESFNCVVVPNEDAQPGDIVTFKFGRVASHLGILIADKRFIHARYDVGRVVINTMQQEWFDKWTKTYTFPGILNG